MNIIKYLDEWMTGQSEKETYMNWLEFHEFRGQYMTLGFFCLDDEEVFG